MLGNTDALQRKESIKANVLKPMWMNKRLFEWLGFPETPEGEAFLETYLAHMFSSPPSNVPYRFDRESGQIEWRARPFPGPSTRRTPSPCGTWPIPRRRASRASSSRGAECATAE